MEVDELNMVESLEWAADYADRMKLFDPKMNGRGYPVDGSKPVTADERAEIIIRLARQACDTKAAGGALMADTEILVRWRKLLQDAYINKDWHRVEGVTQQIKEQLDK